MTFTLNDKEIEKLEDLKTSISVLFDEIGPISYCFSNNNGIGQVIKITFEKHKITKDITDYSSW